MATDIAFVVGALALIGHRVPSGLKLFLLTLAIVDDIGAIVVIAVFYSAGVGWWWLAAAAAALALILVLRAVSVPWPLAYIPTALVLWYATLRSGIHPTIAGVALGLLTPTGDVRGRSVLEDLERRIHPISSYVVIPLFALANAGIVVSAATLGTAFSSRVFWGIALGLVVGKIVGVFGASLLARRTGLGRFPQGLTARDVAGGAALAGIGFTVSLFITELAFGSSAEAGNAKMAVLLGSAASAAIGTTILVAKRSHP